MIAAGRFVFAAMVFAAAGLVWGGTESAGGRVYDLGTALAGGGNPCVEEGGGTWTWVRNSNTIVWNAKTPATDVFTLLEDGRARIVPPAAGFAGAEFAVADSRVYTVKVEAETLADADGMMDLYVLVNKTIVFWRTLDRSARNAEGGAKAELEWCSITPLKPGDKIYVLAAAGRDNSNENDETAVRVRIESEDEGEEWASFDFTEIFGQMIAAGTNWVKCAKGEAFGLYAAGAASSLGGSAPQFADPKPGYERGTNNDSVKLPGFEMFAENAYQVFVVNDSGSPRWTSDMSATYDVTPGDFFVHPGNGTPSATVHSSWAVRFKPAAMKAKYDVCASARDACIWWSDKGDYCGVDIIVLTNGVAAARKRIAGDFGLMADTVLAKGLEVWGDGAIDVILDPRNGNNADGTVLNVKIRSSEPEPTGANVNEALIANMKSETPANPYTGEGIPGTWTAGDWNPSTGAFTPYGYVHVMKGEKIKGYRKGANASNPWPYVMANISGATASPGETANTETGSGDSMFDVGAGHMLFHPGSSGWYSGVKWTAPERGVYRVLAKASPRHWVGSATFGVALPGKGIAETGLVSREANAAGVATDCGRLYVEKGGEVFIGVDPNGNSSCDLTAVRAGIVKDKESAMKVVSFDIEGANGETWTGAGRVGWGTEWVGANRREDAERVNGVWRKPFGEKPIRVGLAVRREGGMAFAAAEGGNALMADGVAAGGVTFEVTGLVPNAKYVLYLYARGTDGEAARFAVGGTEATADGKWFGGEACVAAVEAVADAEGKASGALTGGAAFCGVQVEGADFAEYVPKGTVIILR